MAPQSKRQARKAHQKESAHNRVTKFMNIILDQGGCCFYCGEPMGADCTREHLLARVLGGSNNRRNLRAAHGECNGAVGHLPVSDKLRVRAVGLAEGRAAMLLFAKQLRRADTRMAFEEREEYDEMELLGVPIGRPAVPASEDLIAKSLPRRARKQKKTSRRRLISLMMRERASEA